MRGDKRPRLPLWRASHRAGRVQTVQRKNWEDGETPGRARRPFFPRCPSRRCEAGKPARAPDHRSLTGATTGPTLSEALWSGQSIVPLLAVHSPALPILGLAWHFALVSSHRFSEVTIRSQQLRERLQAAASATLKIENSIGLSLSTTTGNHLIACLNALL